MATFDEFYASLDPDVGVRGKQFEKFVKWFLKTDPTWASQVEEVWLWNDYPKRWGADCGIDLIFTHKNGKTWAVQSKCVSPNNDIKKSEIDSFLSESSDSKIDGRLLIASTDGIGKNAQQVINRQEKQVVCFLLEQFRQSEIEFPSSMEDLNQGKRKEKKKPRPHQIEAIESVSKGLKTANRGQVLMACGTGKTLTSLWIKERLKAKQVLVLLPSLSLLSQTLHEWNAEANESFKWICVCSDKSVAKDKSEDQWISNTSEIGVPVTSETLEIKNFLDESGSKVVFSTYQSAQLIVEAQEHHDTSDFDLVIADEAHRCAGKVSDAFGSVLDENRIKSVKRLFFTATPRILSYQLKTKASENNIAVASMDDPSVFGEVLYQIKFSDAISQKPPLLSDYQVIIVGVDDPMIKNQINNRDFLSTDGKNVITADTLSSIIALSKTIKKYKLSRVITFHNKVNSAKEFAQNLNHLISWIPESDKPKDIVESDYVSGKMNSKERNKKLKKLKNLEKNRIRVISNARCLSEGIDVPALDGIAFIEPKRSQVDIIQAVGRAIRKSPDKKVGTIVIPVYLGNGEETEDAIISSRFNEIWKIILALKAQDDSLTEIIDTLRIKMGSHRETKGRQKGLIKIIFDLPERINKEFSNSIQTLLIRESSDDWLEMFGLLTKFIKEKSRLPAAREIYFEKNLGSWSSHQRRNRRILSRNFFNMLDKLDYWVWDIIEEKWFIGFNKLKKYSIKNETSRVPNHFVDKEGYNLGTWLNSQKQNKDSLDEKKIKLLESLPKWTWGSKEDDWNNTYLFFKNYVETAKTLRVGKIKDSRGIRLQNWISAQKTYKSLNKLSKDKIKKLESIKGFQWFLTEEEKWEDMLSEIELFSNINGHSIVPNDFITEDLKKLGRWTSDQRNNKNSLTLNQRKKLESLPYWEWNIDESKFKFYFVLLEKYLEKNNSNYPEEELMTPLGTNLVIWYKGISRKKDKLSAFQIQKLEELPNWKWNKKETNFEMGINALKKFYKDNDHSNPKTNYVNESGYKLGNFVRGVKNQYAAGKLSDKKIVMFESFEGWLWNKRNNSWQIGFDHLKEYCEREKHASPPQKFICVDGYKLGVWVSVQRRNIDNPKRITPERKKLLEDLSGWEWTVKK